MASDDTGNNDNKPQGSEPNAQPGDKAPAANAASSAEASAPEIESPPLTPDAVEPPPVVHDAIEAEARRQTDPAPDAAAGPRRFASRHNLVPAVLHVPPQIAAEAQPAASSSRFAWPLVATIALAAAVGAIAGSVSTIGVERLLAAPVDQRASDTRALKDQVARLNAELTGMKSGLDFSAKSVNNQLVRLGERVERAERVQAEPAARLARINESLEKIERRIAATPASAPAPVAQPQPAPQIETTGSVGQRLAPPRDEMRPLIQGMFVRNVTAGVASIQSHAGVIEVGIGDPMPGGGRVEAIRRQEGRWVVVTSRGLILSAQR
jgi:hypothetical protein